MLHLICSNVREHQKGKFIVLVTERDIVGASCYLKMINKNSYWFCKVNKSSCSNDSISQWKGLVELVWHSADPPQTAQLSQTVGLSLSAGAFEPNTEQPTLCTENTVVPPPTCWRRFGLGWMDGNNTGAAQRRCDSLNEPLEATCEQVDVKGTKFYSHCFFLGFCVFSGLHGNIPEPSRLQCGSSHSGDSPCRYLGRTVPSLLRSSEKNNSRDGFLWITASPRLSNFHRNKLWETLAIFAL